MNRDEYLDLLRYYLRSLPKTIVEDIIADYMEHFAVGVEKGKTEEEISKELGSPELIARQFIETEGSSPIPSRKRQSNPGLMILIGLGLILVSPFILALLGVFAGILVSIASVFIALVSLGFGGIVMGLVLAISLIPGVRLPGFISIPSGLNSLSPITSILLAIGLVAFSIVIINLGIRFVVWLLEVIKKLFLSIKWEVKKRRKDNEE